MSRAWHDKIAEYLVTIDFHMVNVDHLLYVHRSETCIVVITIYVDDFIVAGDSDVEVENVKGLLKQKFEMKDLGELRYFLGIEVIRMPEGIWLSQNQYALDMLSKYGMDGCKPIFVLLDQNGKLNAHVGDVLEDATMYTKIVGSLIYMTITRLIHELHSWVREPVYAGSSKTTFRWCAAHTMLCEVHIRLCTLL